MDYFKSKNFLQFLLLGLVAVIFVTTITSSLLYFIYFSFNYANNNAQASYEFVVETSVNDQAIFLEIAGSSEEHQLGLSNRASICSNCGMLFLFEEVAEQSFVMRNMEFPLDLLFIDENNVIVKIYENLEPEGANPQNVYNSFKPVIKVLELNAGMVKKLGLQEGDTADFLNVGILRARPIK